MKDRFPEFYVNKNDLNFRNLGKGVLVIFDTNVLLDLYRVSTKLREELKKSMKMVQENVWMPYQVGYEFHNNRKELMHEILNDRNTFIQSIVAKIDESFNHSTEAFSTKNKLYEEIVNNHKEDLTKIRDTFKLELQKVDGKIKENGFEDYLSFLEEIFDGKIEDNREYDYEQWEKEAQERFEDKRPPGYKDYKNKKDDYYFIKGKKLCKAYGDYFLWKEMLIKSKEESIKEVVFITNDAKEDWYFETKGKKVGARIELIEEMIRESSANFRIYSSSTFLYHSISKENYKSIEKEAIHLDKIKKRINLKNHDLDLRGFKDSVSPNHNEEGFRFKEELHKDITIPLEKLIMLNDEFDRLNLNNLDSYKSSEIENDIIDLVEALLFLKDEIEIVVIEGIKKFRHYWFRIKILSDKVDKLEHEISLLR